MLLGNTTQQALHKNLLTTEPIMGLLLGLHHWIWLTFPSVSGVRLLPPRWLLALVFVGIS